MSPSYKRLASVAHNFGHSYLSLTNYQASDYIVEHLFRAARSAGESHIEIDVMAGRISPIALETPVLRDSVLRMRDWLPRSLKGEGCSPDTVRSARILVDFRFGDTRQSETVPGLELAAYDCHVEIVDDRGVAHRAEVPEWWKY